MKISFERTGGFGGLRLAAVFESEQLPQAEADLLQRLVAEADFFSLPARRAGQAGLPDQFHYVITIEAERLSHTVETGEQTAPEVLRRLLQHLDRLARSRRALSA